MEKYQQNCDAQKVLGRTRTIYSSGAMDQPFTKKGRINMRRVIKFTTFLAVVALLACMCISCKKGESTGPSGGKGKVLAKIGKTEITFDRIDEVINRQKNMMAAQGLTMSPEQETMARGKILDDLVNVEVIMQAATIEGISAPASKIDEVFKDEAQRAGGEEQLKQHLLQAGLSEEAFRDRIRQWVIITALREKVTANIPKVPEEEAQKYYDESGQQVTATNIKIIGSKTFYLKKGVWTDSEYREGMPIANMSQMTDAYFNLANTEPTQAKYMSFTSDKPIIVVIGGKAYKIAPQAP